MKKEQQPRRNHFTIDRVVCWLIFSYLRTLCCFTHHAFTKKQWFLMRPPCELWRYLIFFQTPWAHLTASCWSYTLKYIRNISYNILSNKKRRRLKRREKNRSQVALIHTQPFSVASESTLCVYVYDVYTWFSVCYENKEGRETIY